MCHSANLSRANTIGTSHKRTSRLSDDPVISSQLTFITTKSGETEFITLMGYRTDDILSLIVMAMDDVTKAPKSYPSCAN